MKNFSKKIMSKMLNDDDITKDIKLKEIDDSFNEIEETTKTIWKNNSKNKRIVQLPIDARGRYGEHIVKNILESYKKDTDNVEYYEGIQGDWDVKFNNIRIEVKTATLDVNGKFQNENIKKHKLHTTELHPYDVLVLIGVSPNNHHYKVINYNKIEFDKLHNRGKAGTGAAYKMDFKYDKYNLLIDSRQLFDTIIKESSEK